MARAVTSSTESGAVLSKSIRHKAGRNVRGGQLWLMDEIVQRISKKRKSSNQMSICYLSKHRSTLSDIRRSMQSCSNATSCISLSASSSWPSPIVSHSRSVSGSTSAISFAQSKNKSTKCLLLFFLFGFFRCYSSGPENLFQSEKKNMSTIEVI